ncbi:MAG: transcription termination/antitermination NusG family protein [Bacteroidales bacterium]|nr:transcription termination/antitermination NusG family protein [Bacteroidales bacterium]
MLDSKPSWVAVMTYPNAESLVAQRFEDAEPPIEHYLPKIAGRDKRFKKNPLPEKAMFPCYLFARINNKQIYQTRTTRGVLRIVSTQHSIIQVPDRDIENIRRFEASLRDIHIHETIKLVRGAHIHITEGEFAGMEGTIVKGCKDGNFCVSIDVMHVSIVVQLRREELIPVMEEAEQESKYNL